MTKTQIAKLKLLKEARVNKLIAARLGTEALIYEIVIDDILEALTPDLSNMEFTADPEIHIQD